MPKLLRLLFFLPLVIWCYPSVGQYAIKPEQTVEVDSLTDMIKGNLPFDKPFFLKINFKGRDDFTSGYYYKRGASGELLPFSRRERNSQRLLQPIYTSSSVTAPFPLLQPRLKGTKVNSSIIFTVPALEPNDQYEFIINAKPSSADATLLYKLSLLALQDREKAGKDYQVFAKKRTANTIYPSLQPSQKRWACFRKKPGYNTPASSITTYPTLDAFLTFHDDSIHAIITTIPATEAALEAATQRSKASAALFRGNIYLQIIIKQATICQCTDQLHHSLACRRLHTLLLPCTYLYNGESAITDAIVNGQRTFYNSPTSEPANLSAYSLRGTNLKNSILTLDTLITYSTLLELEGTSPTFMAGLRRQFQDLQTTLLSSSNKLQILQKTQSQVEAKYRNQPAFATIRTTYGAASHIYSFQTRNKLRITPDLGLIGYMNVNSRQFVGPFRGVAPYIGLHINFRYIDKEIPFRLLQHKSWTHRLSAHAGWTVVSISDSRSRTDFFSNSSLLTGLGFRFSSELRLIAGGLWFKQYDPNPLIDHRTLAVVPYAGVSVDFELAEFLKNITDVFKK